MPKGIFTQGVCVLAERAAALDEVEAALADFEVVGRYEGSESWALSGPSLAVAYRPECNGLVAVDTVSERWPDHMGDPQDEPMLFAAWSMGHFGPFAFPGGLERSAEQSWSWEPGEAMPDAHRAFLRVRSSYSFGAEDDEAVMPEDYEPVAELEFVTKLACSLLDLPGALCYFNPNGEVLLDRDGLRERLNDARTHGLPPLDAWSNVRLFTVDDDWAMMDTVGNHQLDVADAEACFEPELTDPDDVADFLRNVSLYLLENGEVIGDGDTMDGPGDVPWQARAFDGGLCDPPRPVLRWVPLNGRPVPRELLEGGGEE